MYLACQPTMEGKEEKLEEPPTTELSSLFQTQLPHHSSIYRKLNYFLDNGEIPNIIFHGPAGTGKKTIVYNFLDKIYTNRQIKEDSDGKELASKLKNNVMSVNCCHGKGIKFIRDEIKTFSRMNIKYSEGVYFKSIVLFNADYLTIDAQSALRRCIEKFSFNTRYFIVVENIHKLLNPIVSRFCEIYVPERMIYNNKDGCYKFINLHQLDIENSVDELDKIQYQRKSDLIHSKIGNIESYNNITQSEWIEIIDYFYENGICTLDILQIIKPFFSVSQRREIELDFHKIKGDYRSEKLLMFKFLWDLRKMIENHLPSSLSPSPTQLSVK